MVRKIVFVISIIALFTFIFIGYKYLSLLQKPEGSLFSQVPDGSFLVLELKNPQQTFTELETNNIIWEKLKNKDVSNLDKWVGFFNDTSILTQLEKCIDFNRPVLLSFYHDVNSKFQWVIQQKVNEQKSFVKELTLNATLQENTPQKNHVTLSAQITPIKNIHFKNSDGIISLSNHESALNFELNDSIGFSQEFKQLNQTSSNDAELKVFIHLNRFKSFINSKFNSTIQKQLHLAPSWGSWTELDITIKPDEVYLSGYTNINDSLDSWMGLMKNQESLPLSISNVLPANTAYFFHRSFSDFNAYRDKYVAFESTRIGSDFNHTINSWDTLYDWNARENLLSWIDGSVTYTISQPFEATNFGPWFLHPAKPV